ncbi:conserved membrane protein of unknown function [Rhodovastum atsumiense]|uniref:DUF4239 domain-containing protein n=1 Tax=Rhodovastum atsumiense TaxID=504468 RepID=A0A5M6IN66_9PROT|nr:hypothetical protein [Rhodovastum atsumiense]KAA5609710.1 hypothetical protein F1189_22725 [Rhodovastum atsumiense]CAH2604479.1 conserved membrane protein of unknown function [Rhodovastum atsumiense]
MFLRHAALKPVRGHSGQSGGLPTLGAVITFLLGGVVPHGRVPATPGWPGPREALRRGLGLVLVLAVLGLGISVISLRTGCVAADRDVRHLAVEIQDLDRVLRRLGPPATEARELLFRTTAVLIRDTFPSLDAALRGETRDATTLHGVLGTSLLRLGPGNPVIDEAQSRMHGLAEARLAVEQAVGSAIPHRQAGGLACWLTLVAAALGRVALRQDGRRGMLMPGLTVLAGVIVLLAVAVGAFEGILTVSGEPLLMALHVLADG